MKAKSERLLVVQQLAERREKAAAESLRQCQQQLAAELAQLEQLNDYYGEYLAQINGQQQVGVEELMRYRSFSQHLARSVRQFGQRVTSTRQQLDQLTQEWSQCRQRRRAIDDLIQQARRDEQALIDKQDQKITDELANQRYQRQFQDTSDS